MLPDQLDRNRFASLRPGQRQTTQGQKREQPIHGFWKLDASKCYCIGIQRENLSARFL